MKKIIYLLVAVMILTIPTLAFVGCQNQSVDLKAADENFAKYEGEPIASMSAFDLIMETYGNFLKERNYTREEFFSFSSKVATRDTHLIRKVLGNRVYNQEIIYGTGFDKGTCATRFYYDGTTAHSLINSKKNDISYKSSTKEFTVKNWGEFKLFDGDTDAKVKEFREKITTYDIMSRDCLSPSHSDKVYEKKGIYYCQIKIDCSEEKMNGMQYAAKKEFLDTLGAKETGFSIEDTTIDFAIAKIDGVYKFLIWRRNEKYSGRHSSFPIEISCEQECLCYYTYGNVEITADDLLNLA